MFERFTDEARRAVVVALEEARLRNHNFIGTEHILLGLIRDDECVAAKVLKSLEISLPVVRADIDQIIAHGDETPAGHMPFTPRAKKALDLSQREAFHVGAEYIGTEHLLLGLLREGEGVAAQVLVKLGADLSRAREQVMQLKPDGAIQIRPLLIQIQSGGVAREDTRWCERAERFLMHHRGRWVPHFLIGWPTWFGNRKASGLRGLPGDLAYLRESLFRRADKSD